MRILAGVEPGPLGQFLHAGYLSAYPHEYQNGHTNKIVDRFHDAVPVDVHAALRLTDTVAVAGTAQTVQQAVAARLNAPLLIPAALLVGCAVALPVLYRARRRMAHGRRVLLDGLVLLLAFMFFAGILHGMTGGDTPERFARDMASPDDGTPLRRYANPEAATKVLLYGIIAAAISNSQQAIKDMDDLREEICMPVRIPGDGVAYALGHYARDGWHQSFRLRAVNNTVVVTSDGADGTARTGDDYGLKLSYTDDDHWEESRRTLLVCGRVDRFLILIRSWPGGRFAYHNRDAAFQLTGNDRYDCIEAEPRMREWLAQIMAKAPSGGTAERVLLVYPAALELRGNIL